MKDLDIRTRAFEGVLYRLDKLRSGFAMMAMLFFVLGSSLACDGRSPGGFGEGIPLVTQSENGDDAHEAVPGDTDSENGAPVEEQDDVDTGNDVLVNIGDEDDAERREETDEHLDLEVKGGNAPDTNAEDGPVNLRELNNDNDDSDDNDESIEEEICAGDVQDCHGVCGGNAVVDCAGDCGGNAVEDCFGVCSGNAVEDCFGVCGGNAVEDCAGICNGLTVVDCAGDCGGNAVNDCFGVCGGNAVEDCFGVCGGNAVEDCFGVCGGNAVNDCFGICGGNAVNDCFGICGGNAAEDCFGVCGGNAVEDCHGVCGGNAVEDCHGVCGGNAVEDCFGVCGGNAVEDCFGVCGGNAVEDCFGVCGGNAVNDCFGVCGGNAVEDCFGICGGNAVVDCAGDCGGNAMEDCAGVCNGLTVVDCAGDCGGDAVRDCAGICNGLTVVDCAGDCGGDAVRDCAGICNGLTVFDCNDDCGGDAVEDCFGVCDGSAYIDECGVCGGSGEIYECGCHDIPEGECDCDGNVLDCNGVCGGDGESCESASEESQCSKIEKNSNWDLCDESENSCSGVFYDSAGCGEFCASIGMVCAEVWENLDGSCAPNLNKPRLSCSGGTGHFSDYCVCVDAQECVPSCDGRSCGDDGCGGSCGTCDSGGSCVSGKCQSLYQDSSLLDELVGYGQGTTGGLGGSLCKVTNLKNSGSGSLRACAESSGKKWIQFAVSGNIYLKSDIQVKSNKTIDGRNRKIQIYNKGLNISNQSNIIVTNLIFKKGDSSHDNDAIRIRNGSQDVWVHHCSFSDYNDGLVDIKEGSTDITVSWSKFYKHDKVMLIGASVNDTMDKHIRVTLHHNWFKETKQRHPRLRYGKVHAFNNYYDSWGDYGLGCSYKGQCFSENNVYDAGSNKKAAVYKVGSDTKDAKVSSKGDEFRNGAVFNEKNSSSVFKPSQYYHYNAENAGNNLINKIKARAGWE